MKFLNVIEALIRYVLAAVACIFLVQFFFLLAFGTKTEGTYRLATVSFGRAILCGGIAAWWFYRARKSHLTRWSSPIPQNTVPVSVPAPTTDGSRGSFWREKATVLTIVVVLAAIVLIVMTRWPSQPRFTHHDGAPELMLDTKTSQECWAGPVQKDDGSAYEANAQKSFDLTKALVDGDSDMWSEICIRALDKNPNGPRPYACRQIDSSTHQFVLATQMLIDANNRVSYLRDHPEEQKVIQVSGLAYCKDLR